jgi:hypothetical protein
MQRRGIPSEFQESLHDLNYRPTRPTVFTIESQGGVIAPEYKGTTESPQPMQGEIVREGPIVTPRTQLPTTERLALPAEGEALPIQEVESKPIIQSEEQRQSVMPPIVSGMITTARQAAEDFTKRISNVKYAPYVEGQKRESILFDLDGKQYKAELKGRNKDFMLGENANANAGLASRAFLDGDAIEIKGRTTMPRPMRGKAGEAGFIVSDVQEGAAKVAQKWLTTEGNLPKEMS